MDITYIPMARGFVYLAVVLDWFSRRVLSWRLSITMEAAFCVEALEDAMARHGKPEIFNTDQGSQFTGQAFTGVLTDNAIAISMDGKGAWRDNVFAANPGAHHPADHDSAASSPQHCQHPIAAPAPRQPPPPSRRGQIPIAPAAPPRTTSRRDFVPWRFSNAGRPRAWLHRDCRRPKTCAGKKRHMQCSKFRQHVGLFSYCRSPAGAP